MRLRVIGGMDVCRDGKWYPIAAPKQRGLLALLVVDLGSPVSIDLLVEQLWPERSPVRPDRQVHMLVWRLRRLFGDAEVLRNVRQGYRLALEPNECDVGRFENLRAGGQALLRDDQPAAAVELLEQALELWRGPAYADARSVSAVAAEAVRLEESMLTATEALLDAELRIGRHEGVVARVQGLVAEHPYRERLRALQMTALHRAGRRAEALAAYQQIHHLLDEELGIRPGRDLQRLQQQILAADLEPVPAKPDGDAAITDAVATAEAAVASGPSPAQPPRPAELPPDLASMTGREDEVEQLSRRLAPAVSDTPAAPDAPAVVVIDGMPGVGKTTLAVHAAHRLAARFEDGQLFIDLHGFSGGVRPISVRAALDRLLRSVGVPGARIPTDPEECAALWRTRTAGRRYLVVLDNAASGDQVRSLLPGSGSCAVVVTSRLRLAELEDTLAITLRALPRSDARDLFRSLVGADRLEQVPTDLVEQVVDQCGLPLALRLLASRLRSRPSWAIGEVLARLREDREELVELDVGGRSVASAFRISYEQLDPTDRRLFRLLGLHPGGDLDRYAAAALVGLDIRTVERRLERLVDSHLLIARGYGRYLLHDLVRAYAASMAERDEPTAERDAATRALLDYYLAAACAAMDAFAPAERNRRPESPATPAALPSFAGEANDARSGQTRTDRQAALRWLDTERANLVALAGYAVRAGWPEYAWQLSGCLHRYLQNGSYYSESFELYDHHLRAARAAGDRVREGQALLNLGVAHYRTSAHATAAELQRQALRCLPDEPRPDRAQATYNLGLVLQATSDLAGAREMFERAMAAFRTLGDSVGEARTASALARVSRLLGRYSEAQVHGERALAITHESDPPGVGLAHFSLGMIHRAAGRYEQALRHLGAALEVRREIENRLAQGATHAAMSGALCGLGRYQEAWEHAGAALKIARELDDANGEVDALLEVGELLRAWGCPTEARQRLDRAWRLAQDIGQTPEQARARHALGDACRDLGDRPTAREHWEAALRLYERLGMPEAAEIRVRIAEE